MGEYHVKRIVLPSGKTVEIVYYQADGGEPIITEAREVERYDDVLNDATDRLNEELDRITRENMTEAVERFRTALENDDILPFDF